MFAQAMKPLGMVKDYIESSPHLRLVFPHLRRSPRRADPWMMTEFTVDRPMGIRDPSGNQLRLSQLLPQYAEA